MPGRTGWRLQRQIQLGLLRLRLRRRHPLGWLLLLLLLRLRLSLRRLRCGETWWACGWCARGGGGLSTAGKKEMKLLHLNCYICRTRENKKQQFRHKEEMACPLLSFWLKAYGG